MDPTQLLLLVVIVLVALGFSFLCSLLEAALLSATVGELTERVQSGHAGAGVLLDMKQNHLEYSIGAILTLNTIAHTIGAALSGAQAAEVFGDAWVGVFSGVLTVLILIFTEIIPKTLGTVHAVPMAGFVGKTIKLLVFILKPIIYFTHFLTRLLARGEKKPISRGELLAMVQIATGEGTLDAETSEFLTNALRIDQLVATDIMTPRTVMIMLQADAPMSDLLEHKEALNFSRIPIYDKSRDDLVGYVLTRDILVRLAKDEDPSTALRVHSRDILALPVTIALDEAMERIVERRKHMAVLVDEHGGLTGLLTLEDIVETIFGTEIMDELDAVADLREVAGRLRDKRLERYDLAGQEDKSEDDA